MIKLKLVTMMEAKVNWIVKIPAGYFMTGIHRFKRKRDAESFMHAWNMTPVSTVQLGKRKQWELLQLRDGKTIQIEKASRK